VTPTTTHRRRTSSTSSSGSGAANWFAGLLSTLPGNNKKRMHYIHSAVRVSLENGKLSDEYGWQASDTCLWYLGPKSIKKYEFGKFIIYYYLVHILIYYLFI
jgi:hypothetical protein